MAMTDALVVLDALDKLAQKCLAFASRVEDDGSAAEAIDTLAKKMAVEVGRIRQIENERDEDMAVRAVVPVDCRTCAHYLHGRHACDLFYRLGHDCTEGDQWKPIAIAPLWKKAE